MSPYESNTEIIAGQLKTLGTRLARLRLARNLTQTRLAREAGSSVSSIKRMEAGGNTSLDTFLRALSALGLADRLLAALPDPSVRPVERVRLGGRERQRARDLQAPVPASQWAWANEDADGDGEGNGDRNNANDRTGPDSGRSDRP